MAGQMAHGADTVSIEDTHAHSVYRPSTEARWCVTCLWTYRAYKRPYRWSVKPVHGRCI